jgi:cation:H+ antiporter
MHEGQASMRRALGWVLAGLVLLIGSSRILVWSAVEIATSLGVSDLVIGLTVVAVGTSLPELASSLIASRKGEDDIALGNILGSNLFNTLAVVGLAAAIRPLDADPSMLTRDLPVMGMLTVALFVIGFGFRKMGRVSRLEGAFLLASYLAYMLWLVAGRGV